jgi:hypothetical protein
MAKVGYSLPRMNAIPVGPFLHPTLRNGMSDCIFSAVAAME